MNLSQQSLQTTVCIRVVECPPSFFRYLYCELGATITGGATRLDGRADSRIPEQTEYLFVGAICAGAPGVT